MLNVLSLILFLRKWFIIIGGITKSNKVKIIMDIRVLRYFIEVVQLNGFSRAADALFITQPAISRSIKN
ncbi:LysR-family transcriptional regulator [Proteus mirabilis]|uniref:LysR-family transcriptional regulator n=1 Tax=Proteus mirabilis TaxID=584 RepID=A0A2X2C2U2_PROMI|nr:LysR-family transcriptional regulator [Proteus mirabilis]